MFSLLDAYRFNKDEYEPNVFRALRFIPWVNQYVDNVDERNVLQQQWNMFREDERFSFDRYGHLELQYLHRPIEDGRMISKGLRELRWWESNIAVLSLLAKISIRTIKTSISSGECERKFSVYSSIAQDDELQSLSPETKRTLAMLKMNKHLL